MKAETFPFFTPAVPGLEALLQRELWTLGLHPLTEEGGFFWKGTWRDFYRAQLMLRTAGRVLVRIKEWEAVTFADFERQAADLPWRRFLSAKQAFKLKVSCAKSKLYHEEAIAERLAGWIEDATGAQWFPQAADGEAQIFVLRGWRDRFTLSADGSGEHLHRRGYRQELAKAPLRETIASSLLLASDWVPGVEEGQGRGAAIRFKAPTLGLTDPFCGSGTIVIEAALMARKIPPGMASPGFEPRAYRFQKWASFDPEEWSKTVNSLKSHILPQASLTLVGSDRDSGAVAAAQANAARAGVAADVVFERRALLDARFPEGEGFVVTNPPFGVRVGGGDLRDLYASLGQRLRSRPDLRVAWLCSDPLWKTATGLEWQTAHTFPNGGLDLSIVRR